MLFDEEIQMDECKEVEIFKWIELTKDQKRILSTLADEEEIIKSNTIRFGRKVELLST